jgi:outer membrane protein TolC/preprotein translocase subunit SecF
MANFTPMWSEGTIAHRNGTRTLTIQVDNDRTTSATSIFDVIRPKIEALQLPEGTSISYGGEYEGQKEVFTPMTIALALSVLIIFFILLFQFKKVKLTILIMSTMLLVLPGAAIGLKLMGYPFSLTSFLGITSLCGLVVRNGIIMIDYLVKLRKTNKMSVYESALAAGKRRMRPIFLTSAAAAVGVIPMILSRSLLWGPLGTVICFGLIIGMILTLYILPVLYWLVYKHEDRSRQSAVSSQLSGNAGGNGVVKPLIASLIMIMGFGFAVHAQKNYTLDSCKKITLENNTQIKNSNIEIEASRKVKQAAFTKYFPSISAIGLGVQFSDPLLKIDMPGGNLPVYNGDPATLPYATEFAYFPGVSIGMLEHLYTGAITASQPIFTGGRIINGNHLARLGSDVSEQKLTMSTNDALMKTEQQYWQIISLREKMNTIDSYQHLLDSLSKDVNVAYKAGLINYNDVLKVTLKQSELRMNRLKLDNGIKLATMSFCQHLGITYDPGIILVDSTGNYSDPSLVYTDPQQAVTNRAEYNLVRQNVEAEKLQSKMKLGEYLPQVGVGVGALTYDIKDDFTNNLMAFGTVTIPLTDWWGGSYSLKEQKLKEEIAQNNADYTAQMLKLQIEKAWTDLLESFQQIKIAQESVSLAEDNLKVTSDNYHAGTVGISDLLEAQAIVQNSRDNLTEAHCSYMIKMAQYLLATGKYK